MLASPIVLMPFIRQESYQVQLPEDFLCDACTIRLLRQATEWGPKYQFWSCADVSIVAGLWGTAGFAVGHQAHAGVRSALLQRSCRRAPREESSMELTANVIDSTAETCVKTKVEDRVKRQFTGWHIDQLFADDCWDSSDCNSHGSCVTLDTSVYPKRVCYCQIGYFGRQCSEGESFVSLQL